MIEKFLLFLAIANITILLILFSYLEQRKLIVRQYEKPKFVQVTTFDGIKITGQLIDNNYLEVERSVEYIQKKHLTN